jgi:hypothetical protein
MGYGLAWLGVVLTGAFALYLPNRYSRVSLFLALLAFLVMSVEKVMPNAIYRVKQLGKNAVWLPFLAAVGTCAAVLWIIQRDTGSWLSQIKGVRLTWNVALAAGILAGVFVLRLLSRGVPTDRLRWPGNSKIRKWHWLVLGVLALISSWSYVSRTEGRDMYLAIDDHSKNVMAFFESLPVDSRIMGHPCAMNSVAFLAKRSVLWSCKQPASGRPNVMDDTVKAYFGESLFGVFQFCQQHDVDYLYVDPKSFPKGNQYALLEVPSELKIYEDAGHFVIPCRPPPGEPDIPLELAQMEDAKLTWLAIDPALVQQGSNVDVHLFWEKLNPSAETLQLCLSLISEADDATVPECTSLITARDVRQLEGKAFGFMTYTLEVSPYLNRGNYQIFAEVVSSTDSSSESLTGVIGEIDFNATPRTFASQEDQGAANSIASWADQIALIDVNASNSENHTLEIDLSWRALERMSRSNKVFAHLVAKNGTGLIAQADAVPRNWAYPTNWWEKGEIVTDTLNIPIDGISPGSYQLWLGLYDEETLERLPLDGPTPSDDASYQDAIKIAELEL